MSNSVKKGLLLVGVITLAATNASAALTIPAIDTADVYVAAGAVAVILGIVLGVKKALGFLR